MESRFFRASVDHSDNVRLDEITTFLNPLSLKLEYERLKRRWDGFRGGKYTYVYVAVHISKHHDLTTGTTTTTYEFDV